MWKPRLNLIGLALVLILVLSAVPALAQDEGRTLLPNEEVTGAFAVDDLAQVFTFSGTIGQIVSVTVSADPGLLLSVLLTDAQGNTIAQSAAETSSIPDTTLVADSTYYVTILRALGANLATAGTYTISLVTADAAVLVPEVTEVVETTVEPDVTEEAPLVLTTSGLQVSLTWNSTTDLDLEVRDPVGGSLYSTSRIVPSGGTFGGNANGACELLNANAPTETTSWPTGGIPTGSYEFIVYYTQGCENNDAVPFTVNAVVDGVALPPFQGTVLPNQTFLGSFHINADATATPRESGLQQDLLVPEFAALLPETSTELTRGTPVIGTLTSEQPYLLYTFTAEANDVVSVSMSAINGGSLDTKLFLLDANGNSVALNDDADQITTNAAIRNQILVTSGEYTVVATRYGQVFGGTEGDFELLLSGPTSDIPTEVLALNLPQGAIEISLVWSTNADLQLLVRDPSGAAVFDDVPRIPSGGQLNAAGNVNCRVSETSPVSYISWPEGRLPAGAYEIEVWYQNECGDATPVDFTLNVLVNDQPVISTSAQPLSGERFLTSFTADVNGNVTPGPGGILRGSVTLDYQLQATNALPIANAQTVNGTITFDKRFELYTFQGQAGDVVTVGMTATSGTLDTSLYLIDPNGIEVAGNDDANGEVTDSLISNYTLLADGTYTIIATHYGEAYGATIGAYNLAFSQLN